MKLIKLPFKIIALPVIAVIYIACLLGKALNRISCYIIGPIMLFAGIAIVVILCKYRSYVAYGYHDLEKAYCQLDCFKHKRQIELVYEPIVERHRELIWMIKEKGSLILSYSDDNKSIAPLIYEILEIQNIIFTREETQMDTHLFNERVLNTYLFQIENAVYSVAEELYGKKNDWQKPIEDDNYTDGWLSTYNIVDTPDKKGNSGMHM